MNESSEFGYNKCHGASEDPLKITNLIQATLMETHGEDFLGWIEQYGAPFREIVTRRPEVVMEYIDNPKACVEKIAEELYRGRILH